MSEAAGYSPKFAFSPSPESTASVPQLPGSGEWPWAEAPVNGRTERMVQPHPGLAHQYLPGAPSLPGPPPFPTGCNADQFRRTIEPQIENERASTHVGSKNTAVEEDHPYNL